MKNYTFLFVLFIELCSFFTKAQPVYFSKVYHKLSNTYEWGSGTAEYQNSYYTIGTSGGQNAIYLYFMKTDLSGDTVFMKLIGETWRAYISEGSMIKTDDNNFAFCALASLDTLNGTLDSSLAMLVKIDTNGDTLWTKKYQYSTNKENWFTHCVETTDKGFIISGFTRPLNFTYTAWVIKTDSLGNIQWQNTYGSGSQFYDVEQTKDSGYIFSGCNGGPNTKDLYIVKTDKLGGMQWQKLLGTQNNDNQRSYIHQLTDSNYIVTGAVDTSAAIGFQGKGYLGKLNKNGYIIWEKTYNGANASKLTGFTSKAIEINSERYVIMGDKHLFTNPTPANCWLVKADSAGSFIWERIYNYYPNGDYDSYSFDIIFTSDKGFLISGSVGSTGAPGGQELWLLKLDSLGCDSIDCSLGLKNFKNNITKGIDVYPNPVNNSATISYTIPFTCAKAEVVVYDLTGKRIISLPIEQKGSGYLQFNSNIIGKGVYMFTLIIDSAVMDYKKVIIIAE
jgi:hypothetical protein